MTDTDTARRERPDFGPERGRNLVYVGRNTTIADVVKYIDEQAAEIAALQASCDEWRSRASNKATDNMDLRSEIAALREQIKALEDIIAGAIQRSWTQDDCNKFWIAAGEKNP